MKLTRGKYIPFTLSGSRRGVGHIFGILLCFLIYPVFSQEQYTLENNRIKLAWERSPEGYRLSTARLKDGKTMDMAGLSGAYTLLYTAKELPSEPSQDLPEEVRDFPDSIYRYLTDRWQSNILPVPMNTAGEAFHFFPDKVSLRSSEEGGSDREQLVFKKETEVAGLTATWSLDPAWPGDILVKMTLEAKKSGYFSLATPTLIEVPRKDLAWGMVPGIFQGKEVREDVISTYAYGQGIPVKPVIARERTTSTLCPLLSTRDGLTLAVIPDPGTGRDPWAHDQNTHSDWALGLSLMNRQGKLCPTAYHPVLGEKDSWMEKGELQTFSFRYSLKMADWYNVYKHAIYDIYRFRDFLSLKHAHRSLSSRLLSMLDYLRDDSTSLWNTETYNGREIGAQAYLGGVVGSDRDAMKNADYGAMWMLKRLTQDSILKNTRLPNARNFKLAQQETENGFFRGAAAGQYYLYKSKRFTEEWGDYVEPVALTYYMMLDMGNMLLFDPNDELLRKRLRLAAERLMEWQHADGHWEVAYDHATETPLFTDLQDLRPTFYGLLVAYRILGEKSYLDAARMGADWFIENAVEKGHFLGVCGDARFVPDFATGQSVQALLDLADLTGIKKYRDAATKLARFYTTSVYTHPIPNDTEKQVKGSKRQDWQISQSGLGFEHGGSLGSANSRGPILLASHAGMFVRLFSLTKDPLYLDMARAAVWGRDAFIDPETGVASYYWDTMNAGAGPYPHHAWWQVGWITDYLLAEIELRSGGGISFPRGFIAPKVGPHQTYGFAPGKVFGKPSSLFLPVEAAVNPDNPHIDYLGAVDQKDGSLYLILLNNSTEDQKTNIALEYLQLTNWTTSNLTRISVLDERGHVLDKYPKSGQLTLQLPATGLRVVRID